ncbi:MAG: circadian clock KaiB family protein [Bacteroidia bacterium]
MQKKNDAFEDFENKLRIAKQKEPYDLKLYITGMTPNSVRAVRNLKLICQKYFKPGECKLEIIDVYQNAELAKGEDIIATPTLIKKAPGIQCRLVGDLSDEKKVLRILSLTEI